MIHHLRLSLTRGYRSLPTREHRKGATRAYLPVPENKTKKSASVSQKAVAEGHRDAYHRKSYTIGKQTGPSVLAAVASSTKT